MRTMAMTSRTPLTQAEVREGVVELSIGQPEPSLLPSADLARAAASTSMAVRQPIPSWG